MDMHFIWFVLLIVLFSGYIVLDGFDLGVGMLHLGVKTDEGRRIMFNSIGPVYDANEVWLITAGGALFAAFPDVYATVFSGFYTAFMLFLVVVIGRGVSIEFRGKVDSLQWKKVWDFVFTLSSYMIVLLLGVTLGNLISGVPVGKDKEFMGTFLGLLHPYALLVGITAVMAIRTHGTLYAILKTEGDLQSGFKNKVIRSMMLFLFLWLIQSFWMRMAYPQLITHPAFQYLIAGVIVTLALLIPSQVKKGKTTLAFIHSCIILVLNLVLVGISIFPNLLISNPEYANSLTVYNSSSSLLTLKTLFIIACIGIPIMLTYKIFVYKIFNGKVKIDNSSY